MNLDEATFRAALAGSALVVAIASFLGLALVRRVRPPTLVARAAARLRPAQLDAREPRAEASSRDRTPLVTAETPLVAEERPGLRVIYRVTCPCGFVYRATLARAPSGRCAWCHGYGWTYRRLATLLDRRDR